MYNYHKSNNQIENKTIFEYNSKNNCGIDISTPEYKIEISNNDIKEALNHSKYDISNSNAFLPEASEFQVIRHFTIISRNNFCIDTNIYPLGSCTMKYNPRINEWVANLKYFDMLHPLMEVKDLQFPLSLMWDVQNYLAEISGFHSVSLQPAAGAHSEFTGLSIMKKKCFLRNENRKKILVPDSAHGTNPATANMLNLEVVNIKSNEHGYLSSKDVLEKMTPDVLGIMITNPNTLGIFEKEIKDISDIVHKKGGYVYGDGANLNSLLSYVRPGDIGFDLLHFNLHKTFSTPHGGGGPGCGAIGVIKSLEDFLPKPTIKTYKKKFYLSNKKKSIGFIKSFYPNFSIVLRAWTYIRSMGGKNFKKSTSLAVLNANYIRSKLKDLYHLPYQTDSLHEVVISDKKQKAQSNITALDISKRIMDFKVHPPTIYFPLNVPGAIMIEPTETEGKDEIDYLCSVLTIIANEAKNNPEIIRTAPHNTDVIRPDEIEAVKKPILTWNQYQEGHAPR